MMAKWRNPSVSEQRIAFHDHGVRFKEAKGATSRFRGNKASSPWSNGLRAVTLHHTAGKNSLGYLMNSGNTSKTGYPFANSLVMHGRYNGEKNDGLAIIMSWGAAWHSGTGGPWSGVAGKDSLHLVSHGIEIESLGTREDMTDLQLENVGRMLAAFVELGVPLKNIHRHADWTDGTGPLNAYPLPTNGRKIDTNKKWYPTRLWVDLAEQYALPEPPKPAPAPEPPKPPVPAKPVTPPAKPSKPIPAKPKVSVRAVSQAAVNRGTDPGVKIVAEALAKAGVKGGYALNDRWGGGKRVAYATFQESLGYKGKAADGVPGKASLTALSDRTGLFEVID